MSEGYEVVDEADRGRFVAVVEGHEAELVYILDGDRLDLVHTGVPDAIGGRGVAAALVSAAVERARRERLVLVATCPYVASWVARHPDALAEVTVGPSGPS
ncbi:MAG: GNAT family N-acetyltransferase [Microthrixaceae bacterium]